MPEYLINTKKQRFFCASSKHLEIEMGNISHSQWKQLKISGNKLNKNCTRPNKENLIE